MSRFAAGLTGELLVLVDLVTKGHVVARAEAGAPYDLILVINKRAYKIQVKTLKSGNRFWMRRKFRRPYTEKDCDFFALVRIDTGQIAYVGHVGVSATISDYAKHTLESVIKGLSK